MTDSEIIQIISENNLSVRKIPEKVVRTGFRRQFRFPLHEKETEETFICEYSGMEKIRRIRIPENPGWWMCKEVKNTSSRVTWRAKTDNLSTTLDGSINKYIMKKQRKLARKTATHDNLYVVSRCRERDDVLYGSKHLSEGCCTTLCGKEIDGKWWNSGREKDDNLSGSCKACLKEKEKRKNDKTSQ